MRKKIEDRHFQGERALFRAKDLILSRCLFDNGESPLKEAEGVKVEECTFGYKYPLWYGQGHKVKDCRFLPLARSGIWYTKDSLFENLDVEAPKEFRRCENIQRKNIDVKDAKETLWYCKGVERQDIKVKGDYFGRGSSFLKGEKLTIKGNYIFDSGSDIRRKDCLFLSKDAFWNCKNITLVHCTVNGEYFGWNSENVTLIDCTLSSHQGFCYRKNLKRVGCKVSSSSDLIFEYSENLDCDISSPLGIIKNPVSGTISCFGYEDYIKDDQRIDLSKIKVRSKKENGQI